MNRSRLFSVATFGAVLMCGIALSGAHAADEKKIRPEVGKPLQAAQEDIKAGKLQAALADIAKAEEAENKTEHENFLIAALHEQVYAKSNDWANLAKAAQAMIATGEVVGPDLIRQDQVIVESIYQSKDYAHLSDAIAKYYRDGGNDPKYRQLVAQAYYQAQDFPNAAKASRAAIAETERAGGKPTEPELQLLMSAEYKQSATSPGYLDALLKLDTYYPSGDYWKDTLLAIRKKPSFSDKLRFDNDRLLIELHLVTDPDEIVDYAETAMQLGYPGYGKSFLDGGYDSKILGTGPNAPREKKLLDLAVKSISDDQKALPQEAASATAGSQLLKLGDAYASYGQYDQAISAYLKALQVGNFKAPVDSNMAKLHLGIAYLKSGQKPKAKDMFASIKADDGSAELGQVWAISAGIH